MTVKKVCIDCGNKRRVAKYPGPRCWTCHRTVNQTRSAARKAKHVSDNFGITEAQYQALLAAQGGVCYLCKRKPGKKRLAVDHDHHMDCTTPHDRKKGCPECIRGLLCTRCNRFLGHVEDKPEALERGAFYLRFPPARKVLALLRGKA